MKTRKSITKRFKITKKGKILRRGIGQDHARGKKSGKKIHQMRKWKEVPKSLSKKIKKALNY